MNVLELFAGSRSFGRNAEKLNCNVFTDLVNEELPSDLTLSEPKAPEEEAAQTEAPAEAPSEAPAEVEAPAEAPSEAPAEVEAPAEAPAAENTESN